MWFGDVIRTDRLELYIRHDEGRQTARETGGIEGDARGLLARRVGRTREIRCMGEIGRGAPAGGLGVGGLVALRVCYLNVQSGGGRAKVGRYSSVDGSQSAHSASIRRRELEWNPESLLGDGEMGLPATHASRISMDWLAFRRRRGDVWALCCQRGGMVVGGGTYVQTE